MVSASRNIDVTCFGEVLIDLVAPDVEHLASATSFIRTAGGAPANVAVAAAKLGARSAFVGAVGDEPFGAYLEEILLAHGVDAAGLKKLPPPIRTTLAFVAHNAGGIPDFVFYRSADAAVTVDDVPQHLIERSAFLYLSSMAQIEAGTRRANMLAAQQARTAGTLICVDPNLRPSSWPSVDLARDTVRPLLATADIVKVNEEEATLFAGTSDLSSALEALGVQDALVVITLGIQGCRWLWKGREGNVAAPAVSVADTTGAGDAFVGAMLAELARHGVTQGTFQDLDHDQVEEVLRFAGGAAAASCTELGAMASLPTRARVREVLRST